MHDLLPQENVAQLRKEYRLRVAVVCLVFLFITGIMTGVFLFPSYLVSRVKIKDAQAKEDSVKGLMASIDPSVQATLQGYQSKVKLIAGLQTTSVHDIIQQLVSYQTTGIELTGFSLGSIAQSGQSAQSAPAGQSGQSTQNTRPVSLTGSADTREDLVAFSQALQDSGQFGAVDVPVSSFSKDTDIPFTLNLTIQVQ